MTGIDCGPSSLVGAAAAAALMPRQSTVSADDTGARDDNTIDNIQKYRIGNYGPGRSRVCRSLVDYIINSPSTTATVSATACDRSDQRKHRTG